MLKLEGHREGRFTGIPQHIWRKAQRMSCEVCGRRYGRLVMNEKGGILKVTQAIDHIFSRRWLHARKLKPHMDFNLLSICGSCHSTKLRVEDRLFVGDAYGLVSGLRGMNYPMDRFFEAARGYRLREFTVFQNAKP